jgi:hypothetical protein
MPRSSTNSVTTSPCICRGLGIGNRDKFYCFPHGLTSSTLAIENSTYHVMLPPLIVHNSLLGSERLQHGILRLVPPALLFIRPLLLHRHSFPPLSGDLRHFLYDHCLSWMLHLQANTRSHEMKGQWDRMPQTQTNASVQILQIDHMQALLLHIEHLQVHLNGKRKNKQKQNRQQ